jgi:prepilin-type processing-associated H-X9-DG protein
VAAPAIQTSGGNSYTFATQTSRFVAEVAAHNLLEGLRSDNQGQGQDEQRRQQEEPLGLGQIRAHLDRQQTEITLSAPDGLTGEGPELDAAVSGGEHTLAAIKERIARSHAAGGQLGLEILEQVAIARELEKAIQDGRLALPVKHPDLVHYRVVPGSVQIRDGQVLAQVNFLYGDGHISRIDLVPIIVKEPQKNEEQAFAA